MKPKYNRVNSESPFPKDGYTTTPTLALLCTYMQKEGWVLDYLVKVSFKNLLTHLKTPNTTSTNHKKISSSMKQTTSKLAIAQKGSHPSQHFLQGALTGLQSVDLMWTLAYSAIGSLCPPANIHYIHLSPARHDSILSGAAKPALQWSHILSSNSLHISSSHSLLSHISSS